MKWNDARGISNDAIKEDTLLLVRIAHFTYGRKNFHPYEYHLCMFINGRFEFVDSNEFDDYRIDEIGSIISGIDWVYFDDVLKASGLDNETACKI
jgi:hypothetical protein